MSGTSPTPSANSSMALRSTSERMAAGSSSSTSRTKATATPLSSTSVAVREADPKSRRIIERQTVGSSAARMHSMSLNAAERSERHGGGSSIWRRCWLSSCCLRSAEMEAQTRIKAIIVTIRSASPRRSMASETCRQREKSEAATGAFAVACTPMRSWYARAALDQACTKSCSRSAA